MKSPRIAILGGGVSGLSAAYALKQAGFHPTVYEAKATHGGLLAPLTINGFRFDQAVHLSFGQEPEVRAILDQTPWHALPSVSRCFEEGRWLKHPCQNNLYALPIEERIALIENFIARPEREVRNYRDWLIHQYGEALAERYPLRYTRKYWTVPAEELGLGWIGPRMRRAALKEILYGAFTDATPNTYYIQEMRYPNHGGFGAFLTPLLADLNIQLQHQLTHIDVNTRRLDFANGVSAEYDILVNTLPLPLLASLCVNCPDSVRQNAASLFATAIDLVSVGFADERIRDLWFYIYDEDVAAARAYSPSVKSRDNVPAGCSSLQFEIYSSVKAPQSRNRQELIDNSVYALEKMGIARASEIQFAEVHHMPYGNVVFDLGMEERRGSVLDWLQGQGIASIGRFGAWDYLWSHQCMVQGLAIREHLAGLGHTLLTP